MRRICLFLFAAVLTFIRGSTCYSDEISLKGQASWWVSYDREWQTGLRYIPELSLKHKINEGNVIDAEIALNLNTHAEFDSFESAIDKATLKLYRSWVRYSTEQSEVRIGLQKINFGPAKIMRTLQWFDSLDIRDPLQLTGGVYGMLLRHYFLNNANIWAWGLYGNDGLKGLEKYETDNNGLEFGGRYQFPVPRGELGFSFHGRPLDTSFWNVNMSEDMSDGYETRYAFDGNWDLGIGLWVEASAEEVKINDSQERWRKLFTIGGDYTFSSGVRVSGEHYLSSDGTKMFSTDKKNNITAVSLGYGFNFIDNVQAIGYYNWEKEEAYYYLGWLRTYDNWQFNLSVFSNRDDVNTLRGTGAQFMVIYNH